MEFAYLSDITGEPLFKNLVERVRTVIQESSKPNTLYPNYLNPKTGKWGQQVIFNFYILHEYLFIKTVCYIILTSLCLLHNFDVFGVHVRIC